MVVATQAFVPLKIASAQDVRPSQVTRQVRELESAGLYGHVRCKRTEAHARVALRSTGFPRNVGGRERVPSTLQFHPLAGLTTRGKRWRTGLAYGKLLSTDSVMEVG